MKQVRVARQVDENFYEGAGWTAFAVASEVATRHVIGEMRRKKQAQNPSVVHAQDEIRKARMG